MSTKQCRRCGEVKPLTEFYRCPRMRDGHFNQCLSCVRTRVRALRPGEPVPASEPKRYPNDSGYIRLRWRVGERDYVEVYEHRVRDGVVAAAAQVHHVNGRKADNRPENLMPLTAKDHGRQHMTWNIAEAMELYRAGWSTPRLAARFGQNQGNISRALRRYGVTMRPPGRHFDGPSGAHTRTR